jgi:hypothetical protein
MGMQCRYSDENCFCTSVGLSPDSEKGSDLFLYENYNEFILKAKNSWISLNFLRRKKYLNLLLLIIMNLLRNLNIKM